MNFSSRRGIAYRTAWIVAGVALLAGMLSLALIGPIADARNRDDALSRLHSLVDTVANTTSAACFVEDTTLARDVANGLLQNSVINGVVIRSASRELANVSRAGQPWSEFSLHNEDAIVRQVFSPFDAASPVGEIVLIPNHDELTRLSHESLFFTASVLILQLCAITLASIFAVFRWIVLPIKTMSDRLHQMREGQRESLDVPAGHAHSELGRLAVDINELTFSLAHAKDVAEQASRSKGDFLATMSHEIRTPINAVVGMAYLALKTELSARQRDYLEKISDSGRHLLDLVNDVLDFAKIESGKMELELATFSLARMIERIESIAALKARQKGLALSFSVSPGIPPNLVGDSLRIGQILLNYINNAIKFTPAGSVEVRARLVRQTWNECTLMFEVSDTGIGLTEEQISRLFSLFHQGDVSTTRKYGGTGLGLAIARQLAELMGGKVGVSSRYGVGSTFWATLSVGLPSSDDSPVAQTGAAERSVRLDGARILLAEDNPLNQQIAQEMLEDAGAIVSLANDGREAIEQATGGRFDCILMDVRMPGMDGLQATQALRGNAATESIPIIAMTANAMIEDREECLRVGMNDFISKPVSPDQFFLILEKWIMPPAGNDDSASAQATTAGISGVRQDAGAESEQASAEPWLTAALSHVDLRKVSPHFKNDPRRIHKLVMTFIESARQAVSEARQACATQDAVVLAQIGHRHKASARWLGANAFADLMQELERSAKTGAQEQMVATVALIEAEWMALEDELQAIADSTESAE